jgi:hypothetical protein
MERNLKTNNEAANNVPVPGQQSYEDSAYFITDVWHLCDRVLQRWMPHLTFDEHLPEKTNLIQ